MHAGCARLLRGLCCCEGMRVHKWCSIYNALSNSQRPYQSHSEEHDLKDSPNVGGADDVAVPHRRHGHHEEIDTLPITQVMHIGKVGEVARVLKL